jgi:nicotinate dehydrogenase subunit B
MSTFDVSRRGFLLGTGGLAVSFSLGSAVVPGSVAAAAAAGGVRITKGAAGLAWLVLTPQAITIHSGKVELGTGVRTALTQIVVEELHFASAKIRYVQGDTLTTPDQGTTAGSKSIQNGGPELRAAAATAFQALLDLAARYFGAPRSRLAANDGVVTDTGTGRTVSYTRLLSGQSSVMVADVAAPLASPADYKVVGQPVARAELPGKLTAGFRYVQDVRLPNMLHGRVIRPSGRNASFGSYDDTKARGIPGFVKVVHPADSNFVGVVAETEWAAIQAADPDNGVQVTWQDGQPLVPQASLPEALRDPAHHYRTVTEDNTGDVDAALATAAVTHRASYFTPFQMHAGMGPSCSVADVRRKPNPDTGVQATVWSSTQGVYALRATVASLLGLSASRVRVIYEEGAGCYGHNGADDVAADAALLSQAVGRPVRVQYARQDEHGWEPLGPAMAHDLQGGITDGRVVAWEHVLCTPTHNSRPGGNGNPGTVIAGQLTGRLPASLPTTAGNAGGRNGPVTYAFPNHRLLAHLVRSFETQGPDSEAPAAPLRYRFLRSTALRSLGGVSNTFANESFLDELAAAAGVDPLKLRLDSLEDPRALAVVEALSDAWAGRPVGNGAGAGIAFAQYETEFAYAAVYAEVDVDSATGVVRVTRVVVSHDCGLVVNPDGLRNQLEGNVIQGVSRALKEEVQFDSRGVTSVVWQQNTANPTPQYPILRFNEVPRIESILINRPEEPAWGAGEPTIVPVPAAIGNAIYAATGARLRQLPMTPPKVLSALQSA